VPIVAKREIKMRNSVAVLGITALCFGSVSPSTLHAGTPAKINFDVEQRISYLHPYDRYFLGHRLTNYAPPQYHAPRRYRAGSGQPYRQRQHERYFGLHASSTNWRYPPQFHGIE
jgi:hypothetical protein